MNNHLLGVPTALDSTGVDPWFVGLEIKYWQRLFLLYVYSVPPVSWHPVYIHYFGRLHGSCFKEMAWERKTVIVTILLLTASLM